MTSYDITGRRYTGQTHVRGQADVHRVQVPKETLLEYNARYEPQICPRCTLNRECRIHFKDGHDDGPLYVSCHMGHTWRYDGGNDQFCVKCCKEVEPQVYRRLKFTVSLLKFTVSLLKFTVGLLKFTKIYCMFTIHNA